VVVAIAWLVLSAGDRPEALPAPEVANVPMRPLPELDPDAGEREQEERRASPEGLPREEIPRTRLPPGHKPASGPSIARVKIPSIGVDAPMIRLGLNRDRTLQVPASASKTGWWSRGAFPGKRGPAVIAGHVDSVAGPSVFYRLRQLSRGDRVYVIDRDGSREVFTVTHSEQHPKNSFPTNRVYNDTPEPTLRLITCDGRFNRSTGRYPDNLIVFGSRA
jgi:LPXTG-site transpeptidase (sortase) family protein